MDRHSEKVDAALWALLKQGKGPKYILEALAEDECGIGYPVDLKRSTFYDRKRKLIRQFGDPAATVDPGEEDEAIDAMRREAIGAIRQTVRDLKSKRERTPKEITALNAALLAADGYERRRRDKRNEAQGARGKPAQESAPETFADRLTKQMRETVANDVDRSEGNGSRRETDQSKRDDHDGGDTLAPVRVTAAVST